MTPRKDHRGPRRATPKGGSRRGSSTAPVPPEVAAVLSRVLEGARTELLGVPSAGVAEYWASILARIWHEQPVPAARTAFGLGLVELARRTPAPEALAMMRALAAVETDDLAGPATDAADELARRGVPEPRWGADLGGARPLRAVAVMEDEFDDGTSLLVEYEHPDGVHHTLGVYIDHNLGHMAKDAFLAGDFDEVSASVKGDGIRAEAIALADAGALLAGAVAATDRRPGAPVSESYWGLRALLGSRLRALPPGGRGYEPLEVRTEERRAIVEAFAASPEAVWLGDGPEVAGIASILVDFASDHVDGRPLRWSPVVVELLLADWFPRAVTAPRELLERVPDVLSAFIRYAGRLRGLSEAAVEETLAAVTRWDGALLDAGGEAPGEGDDGSPVDEATWVIDQVIADREAAEALREALRSRWGDPPPDGVSAAAAALRDGYAAGTWPHPHLWAGAGFDRDPPAGAEDLVVRSVGAYTRMQDGLGLEPDEESLILALERTDWLAAVVDVVRAGPGTPVDGDRLAGAIVDSAEIPGVTADGEEELIAAAFELVLPAWGACGVVDGDGRLTPVGAWALPRGLARAWDVDFDTGTFL